MTITRDTPWRHAGAVPFAIWTKRITDAGGLSEYAEYEVWAALGDDSALALEQLEAESSYASKFRKIPADWWNAWNLQIAGVGLKFDSALEAAQAWRARLYDPNYKQGVYLKTTTIADLIYRYAPPEDGNDTEGYIAGLVAGMNRNGFDPPVTTPATPEEPVEQETDLPTPESIKPPFIVAPVTKRSDGQGFNYGTRAPIVGLVIHETQGLDSGKGYQKFFSCLTDTSCKQYGICADGERCQNALVDWLIDQQGQLFEYQDPYDTNRIPWASGGAENNSNAIGRAINAKYRQLYGGVNRVYAAVEMVKTDNGALTPAQIQTAGRLLAFVMAKAGYPAEDWEYPDTLGGNIYTAPHHSDVSQTTCRISDSDKAAIKAVCTKTLAAFYEGTTPGEEPTIPPTPAPVVDIIPGVDLAIAKRLFGIAKGEDGNNYSYDPNGPVSKLWTDRGKATGEWPALVSVYSYEDGKRRYFVFDGGTTIIAVKGQDPRWLKEAA